MTLQSLSIGTTASESMHVTDAVVQAFADVSGDHNPVHLDAAYASGTRFKERIAHGMLAGALVSSVIGNRLPGHGTIYLSQSLQFKAPVFCGDHITAKVTIVEHLAKGRLRLRTEVHRSDGTLVVDGEAVVIPPATP